MLNIAYKNVGLNMKYRIEKVNLGHVKVPEMFYGAIKLREHLRALK